MKTARLSRVPGPRLRDYPRGAWDLLFGARAPVRDSSIHLDAAMSWLCRAQDVNTDGGLARMFHVREGWGASYPETTGYAIPTFLDYAQMTQQHEYAERAQRMAEWESRVQFPSGAVQGGVVTEPATPAIFNTGQVLFGWCAAYRKTEKEAFRDSALRAAQYLCDVQDDDGAWRRHLSDYTDAEDDSYAFNIRTAWALRVAHQSFGVDAFEAAALANLDYVSTLAHDNGWIEQNCLNRPEQPLLHTIAYSHQGLLELSQLCEREAALDLVVRGSTHLLAQFRKYGRLHGRYERAWQPTVRWRCLTGEAQTAIIWFRLGQATESSEWTSAARELVAQLKSTQSLTGHDGVRGGVKGSHPITGAYGRLEYLNWAAKFFADALMLDMGVARASCSG